RCAGAVRLHFPSLPCLLPQGVRSEFGFDGNHALAEPEFRRRERGRLRELGQRDPGERFPDGAVDLLPGAADVAVRLHVALAVVDGAFGDAHVALYGVDDVGGGNLLGAAREHVTAVRAALRHQQAAAGQLLEQLAHRRQVDARRLGHLGSGVHGIGAAGHVGQRDGAVIGHFAESEHLPEVVTVNQDYFSPIRRPAKVRRGKEMQESFKSFREFYPYYLDEHRNRTCRRLHFIGSTLVLAFLVAALVTWNPWWLLGMPLAGYGFEIGRASRR